MRRCAKLEELPEAQFAAEVRIKVERKAASKLLARSRAADCPFLVGIETSRR